MQLYHYTSLLNLPDILKQGLNQGQIPVNFGKMLTGPNFTTSDNRGGQAWAHGSGTNKTKVRLTVNVPEDTNLKSWRKLCKEHGAPARFIKQLDSTGASKWWYIYLGTVPPEYIEKVEVLDGEAYRRLDSTDLEVLLAAIEKEKEKLERSIGRDGQTTCRLRDGYEECWLLDAVGPVYVPG